MLLVHDSEVPIALSEIKFVAQLRISNMVDGEDYDPDVRDARRASGSRLGVITTTRSGRA